MCQICHNGNKCLKDRLYRSTSYREIGNFFERKLPILTKLICFQVCIFSKTHKYINICAASRIQTFTYKNESPIPLQKCIFFNLFPRAHILADSTYCGENGITLVISGFLFSCSMEPNVDVSCVMFFSLIFPFIEVLLARYFVTDQSKDNCK